MPPRHGNVNGACPSPRHREGYAEIRVECIRVIVTGGAAQTGVVLSTEEDVYETVVALEVIK